MKKLFSSLFLMQLLILPNIVFAQEGGDKPGEGGGGFPPGMGGGYTPGMGGGYGPGTSSPGNSGPGRPPSRPARQDVPEVSLTGQNFTCPISSQGFDRDEDQLSSVRDFISNAMRREDQQDRCVIPGITAGNAAQELHSLFSEFQRSFGPRSGGGNGGGNYGGNERATCENYESFFQSELEEYIARISSALANGEETFFHLESPFRDCSPDFPPYEIDSIQTCARNRLEDRKTQMRFSCERIAAGQSTLEIERQAQRDNEVSTQMNTGIQRRMLTILAAATRDENCRSPEVLSMFMQFTGAAIPGMLFNPAIAAEVGEIAGAAFGAIANLFSRPDTRETLLQGIEQREVWDQQACLLSQLQEQSLDCDEAHLQNVLRESTDNIEALRVCQARYRESATPFNETFSLMLTSLGSVSTDLSFQPQPTGETETPGEISPDMERAAYGHLLDLRESLQAPVANINGESLSAIDFLEYTLENLERSDVPDSINALFTSGPSYGGSSRSLSPMQETLRRYREIANGREPSSPQDLISMLAPPLLPVDQVASAALSMSYRLRSRRDETSSPVFNFLSNYESNHSIYQRLGDQISRQQQAASQSEAALGLSQNLLGTFQLVSSTYNSVRDDHLEYYYDGLKDGCNESGCGNFSSIPDYFSGRTPASANEVLQDPALDSDLRRKLLNLHRIVSICSMTDSLNFIEPNSNGGATSVNFRGDRARSSSICQKLSCGTSSYRPTQAVHEQNCRQDSRSHQCIEAFKGHICQQRKSVDEAFGDFARELIQTGKICNQSPASF